MHTFLRYELLVVCYNYFHAKYFCCLYGCQERADQVSMSSDDTTGSFNQSSSGSGGQPTSGGNGLALTSAFASFLSLMTSFHVTTAINNITCLLFSDAAFMVAAFQLATAFLIIANEMQAVPNTYLTDVEEPFLIIANAIQAEPNTYLTDVEELEKYEGK